MSLPRAGKSVRSRQPQGMRLQWRRGADPILVRTAPGSGEKRGSWPVSRVLSRTVIHLRRLSPGACSDLPGSRAGHTLTLPYLVLLRAGFALPPPLPATRCALTAPFHPYRSITGLGRYRFCGTFRRLAPPRRYLAPCPVEPGLSSAMRQRLSGQLLIIVSPLSLESASPWLRIR